VIGLLIGAAALVSASPRTTLAPARLPGFAAALAERPLPTGAAAWSAKGDEAAWTSLAAATPATRQALRWDYATSLIARGLAAEAIGVLDVMRADDPDLALVPAWMRARGVAAAMARHTSEALTMLGDDTLLGDSEACLWRMRTLANSYRAAEALGQLRCAMPALTGRTSAARRPFVIAAGSAAVDLGRASPAMAWLNAVPDDDPAANLLRGKAYALLGQMQPARLRLDRVILSGDSVEQADARLATIENGVASHTLPVGEATRQLETLLFTWRGDRIERRALELSVRLATATHDTGRMLASGATLFRYFDLGAASGPLVAQLQTQLAQALAPGSALSLVQAAGMFWDYRDIAPAGPVGNQLVENLVNRLQAAGLYGRAADLLDHRLDTQASDVERGPLTVRIASLQILAGTPDAAIRTLRGTDILAYPPDTLADRRRVEAAALQLLGKSAEALATVEDVPGGGALTAELYWRAHDWARLAAVGEQALPKSLPGAGRSALSEVGQAIVLRQAIALAMLGRESDLAALRSRYGRAFETLPTGSAFATLTAQSGSIDPATLSNAMAALPAASPAGAFGDLLDQGSAAMSHPTKAS
jgi:hypothetical protein